MKKIFSFQFSVFFLMTVLLSACHITSSEEPVAEETPSYEAYGQLTITSSGFTKDDVRTKVVLVSSDTLDLYMYEVKFAALMPVTIDMVVSGVAYTKSGNQITFRGDGIVPTAGNKPYEKYVIRDLEGTITADSLILSNKYGDTPSIYRGQLTTNPLTH